MAELMGGDGGGVIGFDAVSPGDSAFGEEGQGEGRRGREEQEVLNGSSNQFQVVMKQLGKRDTTTKLKVR